MYCIIQKIEFFYHMKREGNDESKNVTFCTTVGENIIVTIKYEIIMVLSNHSNFQYCCRNIGLFSIAPCNVIILNPLCILFCISSLLLFWCLSLSKVIALTTIAIAKRLLLLFANAFKNVKEWQLLLSQ